MQARAVESSYERLNPKAALDVKKGRTLPRTESSNLSHWLWFPYRHLGIIIITLYQVRISQPSSFLGIRGISIPIQPQKVPTCGAIFTLITNKLKHCCRFCSPRSCSTLTASWPPSVPSGWAASRSRRGSTRRRSAWTGNTSARSARSGHTTEVSPGLHCVAERREK